MARKKKHEEHENHERWLVSYADFITLLFAFFVVMYSVSSVNEGKYRVLSESLTAAFRSSARSLNPIQVGMPIKSPHIFAAQVASSPKAALGTPIKVDIPTPMPDVKQPPLPADTASHGGGGLDKLSKELEEAFEKLIDEKLVSVRRNPFRLEIEVNTKILFASGSTRLAPEAVPVVGKLGHILEAFDNKVQVEGFTDDEPIKSQVFPSNWELSAARAATVVRLFAEFGVEPRRLSSVGYGQFQPIADNSTAEGRAKNRRVVIVVKANLQKVKEGDFERLRGEIEKMARMPLPQIQASKGSNHNQSAPLKLIEQELEIIEDLL